MNWGLKAVGAFAVLLMLFKGLALLYLGTPSDLIWGLMLMCLAAGVLWFTVDLWPKWLFGFCAANVLRCAAMGLVGRAISYPSTQAPRAFFWEMAGILAVMTFELYPFLHERPKLIERFSLILVPIALAYSLLNRATIMLMLVPVLLLAPSNAYRLFVRAETKS
jgi:hypothetical protein